MPGPIVAGAAPELILGLLGLFALLAWAISRGLLAIWVHTFGAILQAMGRTLNFDIRWVHVRIGDVFFALDHTVHNALHTAAVKSEHAAGYFFHVCALIVRWMAREIEQTANDVADFADWLTKVHLPIWVKAAIYAAFPPFLIARLVKAAIDANLPHLGRVTIGKIGISRAQVKAMIAAAIAGVAIPTLPHIRIPWRVRDIEHDLAGIKARLRALEKGAAIAVTVGLAAAILRKLKLGCLLGRNGKTLGKELCRVDPDFFASLFLDGLVVLGAVSVVTFAKEMLAVEDEAVKIMGKLVKEFPG